MGSGGGGTFESCSMVLHVLDAAHQPMERGPSARLFQCPSARDADIPALLFRSHQPHGGLALESQSATWLRDSDSAAQRKLVLAASIATRRGSRFHSAVARWRS